jgi:hypothetical protein
MIDLSNLAACNLALARRSWCTFSAVSSLVRALHVLISNTDRSRGPHPGSRGRRGCPTPPPRPRTSGLRDRAGRSPPIPKGRRRQQPRNRAVAFLCWNGRQMEQLSAQLLTHRVEQSAVVPACRSHQHQRNRLPGIQPQCLPGANKSEMVLAQLQGPRPSEGSANPFWTDERHRMPVEAVEWNWSLEHRQHVKSEEMERGDCLVGQGPPGAGPSGCRTHNTESRCRSVLPPPARRANPLLPA